MPGLKLARARLSPVIPALSQGPRPYGTRSDPDPAQATGYAVLQLILQYCSRARYLR